MTLDFGPRVDSDVQRIKDSDDLTGRDKELLLDFKRDMKLDDNSFAHIHKTLTHLNLMGERLPDGFENATEEDVKDVVALRKKK